MEAQSGAQMEPWGLNGVLDVLYSILVWGAQTEFGELKWSSGAQMEFCMRFSYFSLLL